MCIFNSVHSYSHLFIYHITPKSCINVTIHVCGWLVPIHLKPIKMSNTSVPILFSRYCIFLPVVYLSMHAMALHFTHIPRRITIKFATISVSVNILNITNVLYGTEGIVGCS